MGKKSDKRALFREQQKRFVEKRKEERRQEKLESHDGYNVTNKVFNANKFLLNLYNEKSKIGITSPLYEVRFAKNICIGIGLPNVIPDKIKSHEVIEVFRKHNLSNVFREYVAENQGNTNINMRALNGSYLILLNSLYGVDIFGQELQQLAKKEKIGKNDYNRWISTAVNKILDPFGILDELLLLFKTERELEVDKMKYKNASVLNKSPIKILAYCQKNNMEYVDIKTRFDIYHINVRDLFKGGPFEAVGERNLNDIDENGVVIL